METATLTEKAIRISAYAREGLRRLGRALGKILFFSLADERLAPGQCVAVHLESGRMTVAYGVRFLSRVKIKGIRQYPCEAGKYPTPEGFASSVSLALNGLKAQQADITLVVPKTWTILKTADFPLVVKENLTNVVGYELDRLTPLSPERAYYDYQVLREDENRLQIILAALRAETLDPYLQALGQRGIPVKRVIVSLSALGALCQALQAEKTAAFLDIRPEGYEGGLMEAGHLTASFTGTFPAEGKQEKNRLLAAGINPLLEAWKKAGKTPTVCITGTAGPAPELSAGINAPVRFPGKKDLVLPSPEGGGMLPFTALGGLWEDLRPRARGLNLLDKGVHKPAGTPLALTGLLVAVLAALGVFALAASLQVETGKVEALEREIAARKSEVRQVEALQKERLVLEKELHTIYRFKTGRPMVMDLYKELTRLLPNNAWLARVRITDATIDIDGYAATTTDLLPKLEASRYFQKVEFASPTFRDVRLNADRFAIKMGIEGLGPEEKKEEKKNAKKQ